MRILNRIIDIFSNYIQFLAEYIWNNPFLIIFIFGVNLYFSFRLRFIQFKALKIAFKILFQKQYRHQKGEISPYKALIVDLSGAVGSGNIVGVAMAILLGGPGAVFWMWITAIVGMISKLISSTLSFRYRQISPDGQISGGPMYTLKNGLNMPKLALAFSWTLIVGSITFGNVIQSQTVIDGFKIALNLEKSEFFSWNFTPAFFLSSFIFLVILGGIRRISSIITFLFPSMILLYLSFTLFIIFSNLHKSFQAIQSIFTMAFNSNALLGATFVEAIRWGTSRGIFSNESSMGSSAIVHSIAKTKQPVQQGMISVLTPLIDTILICTTTALVIIISGVWKPDNLNSTISQELFISLNAFQFGLAGSLPNIIFGFSLVFFATTTVFTWYYYGERAFHFIFPQKSLFLWKLIYVLFTFFGIVFPSQLVWNLAEVVIPFMVTFNIISMFLLFKSVRKMFHDYFN